MTTDQADVLVIVLDEQAGHSQRIIPAVLQSGYRLLTAHPLAHHWLLYFCWLL